MENTLVKQLAGHRKETREQAFESLRKYLTTRNFQNAKQSQFDKLWKGLYYSMWHCDKPIPQQSLAYSLGELHLLYLKGKNQQAFIRFSKAFWKVICIEWYRIDHHRLDKFLLLIRRCLHFQIKYLHECEWEQALVDDYINKVLKKIPLSGDRKVYNGIPFHIIDILLDEWVKVCYGEEEDEEDNEDDKEEEIKEAVSKTPLSDFISIFQELSSDTNNIKILRDKIKEDLLKDQRLRAWDVLQSPEDEQEAEEEEAEEWHGF
ncbi:Rrp1p [Kluyveromyces lactis]|uniref:KLLA0C11979p n=1 Tax=Kluyveromyces lactis (strain ATCC 8585 / CBS 2359 / DSM 70799 / NBRC 1267 / NRRL Y-1140 / WM37) TaxID=284590 RepID=Q6CTK4_KLULA|nr:uncharacterized protein KLLA0_C11979g [Kluyveromyces lactis]CAH01586.1 KLLA0C11979p [Kluyveromyces lactis]|eukprot:XP_452735.1 uncharacterized protein KLLA0_C11979g [Kluyveromyces lactis]